LICSCGKEFFIEVWASFAGGYVQIDNLVSRDGIPEFSVEEIPFPVPYELDAILSNAEFFDTFQEEISNIKRLNELTLDDQALEKTLKRQLFVGTIACMETYLSDAFIVTTLSEEKYLRAFVKTFKDFKDRKIGLKDIFDYHQKIKDIAKKEMYDVIYHNLPKVSGMYKDTLGVTFPEMGDIVKAVFTRHDLVHRNGKTKDGQEVSIDKEVVTNNLDKIEVFIRQIDEDLKAMIEDETPF
jgi:hypothetical protein